jgi:hypothetical protein
MFVISNGVVFAPGGHPFVACIGASISYLFMGMNCTYGPEGVNALKALVHLSSREEDFPAESAKAFTELRESGDLSMQMHVRTVLCLLKRWLKAPKSEEFGTLCERSRERCVI